MTVLITILMGIVGFSAGMFLGPILIALPFFYLIEKIWGRDGDRVELLRFFLSTWCAYFAVGIICAFLLYWLKLDRTTLQSTIMLIYLFYGNTQETKRYLYTSAQENNLPYWGVSLLKTIITVSVYLLGFWLVPIF